MWRKWLSVIHSPFSISYLFINTHVKRVQDLHAHSHIHDHKQKPSIHISMSSINPPITSLSTIECEPIDSLCITTIIRLHDYIFLYLLKISIPLRQWSLFLSHKGVAHLGVGVWSEKMNRHCGFGSRVKMKANSSRVKGWREGVRVR